LPLLRVLNMLGAAGLADETGELGALVNASDVKPAEEVNGAAVHFALYRSRGRAQLRALDIAPTVIITQMMSAACV